MITQDQLFGSQTLVLQSAIHSQMPTLEKHVTVLDDDHDVLAITKIMLESNGYKVQGFTDPEKALVHAKDCEDCDIVLTDLRMPKMTGFELVRELKKLRPDIRVVLMTAFEINNKEWERILPSTKVDQFLTKPFNSTRLVAAIENCTSLVNHSQPSKSRDYRQADVLALKYVNYYADVQ